jgi:predicted TPR repeat methyltransferase/thioredoxin-like negative regulator of GroEL
VNLLPATANAETLIQRISELLDTGRVGAARPLLAAARRLVEPSPGLAQLAARIAFQDGDLGQALHELDDAVSMAPEHSALRRWRADLRRLMGDLDGAARDAAEAVILDPRNPAAKALLGVMMLHLGRTQESVACLTEAVAADPADPSFREALATSQEAAGDADAALASLLAGIAAAPNEVALCNAAVLLCIRRRDYSRAVRLAESARATGIADACLFGLKGHALASLGRHSEAAEAYQEALKLQPDDPNVRHLAAAAGWLPNARRAPTAFLLSVFNEHADRFEDQLISLGYRLPGAIRNVLLDHPDIVAGRQLGPVLDLGCGTGLMALLVSDLPIGPITGVDISPRMLAHARVKGLYSSLHEADIMEFLAQNDAHWKLILAADVVSYFGALEELLDAVHAQLEPGGWFVFSVEELVPDHGGVVPGDGKWALLRQGRYTHAVNYVYETACKAGFRVNAMLHEVARQEAGTAVPVLLAMLERTRCDG